MKWTNDQEKAISTTDKGVIVSAAAGSGKTAVLVERIIRLLCDSEKKIPADTLVAVTFTNDAASQMREKITAALEKKVIENPSDEWLLTQQMKLPFAKISTINSFCYDLVKTYADEFDIQSGVRIIDENELDLLKEVAMDNCFEIACEDKFDEFSFAYKSLCKKSDANLRDCVRRLSEFKRSIGFPEKWVELCRRYYKENLIETSVEIHLKSLEETFMREAKLICNEMNRALCGIPGFSMSDSGNYVSLNCSVIQNKDYCDATEKLYSIYNDAVDKIQMFDVYKGDVSPKFVMFKVSTYTKKLGEYADFIQKFYSARDKLKACFSKYHTEYIQYASADPEVDNEVSLKLFDAVNMLSEIYDGELWQLKMEKNAIEFSDNEIMAVKLLAEMTEDGFKPSEIAKRIVEQGVYNIVLMDEYQDVNNLQDIIFKCISKNGSDKLIGTNEFVVGDIKQAIYKFRLTNPKIMSNARKNAQEKCNSGYVEEIILHDNFRSRRNVVDFTNFVFELLMSKSCGDVQYDKSEKLQCSAQYNNRVENTEIIIAQSSESEVASEYIACATKIDEMIKNGALVFENGSDRKCRPSDFCIITRTNDSCASAAKALEIVGLKSTVETKEAYLKSREVSVLINMLKVVDMPTNDIALVAVLLSDMFMFTDEEIAKMRLLNKSGRMNFYMIMNNIASQSERSSEEFAEVSDTYLGDKVRRAIRIIKELRVLASCLSVDRLISKIFDYTDYFSIASTYENALQKRANLRLLQNYAYTYESNVGGGLGGFIRYINSISDSKGDLPQAVVMNENTDAVSVKTIHKSKGLEYPFVFICDLASEFKIENKQQMLVDEEMGVAFKIRDYDKRERITTNNYRIMLNNSTMQSKSESMRLLYVAMTRAREKLFICFENDKNFERDMCHAIELAKSYYGGRLDPNCVLDCLNLRQWVFSALVMHPEFVEEMSEKYDFSDILAIIKKDDIPQISVTGFEGVLSENQAEQEIVTDVDFELYNKLSEVVRKKYDEILSNMTSKLSVTEIAKNDDEGIVFYPQVPAFSDELEKLSAAEKGTAVHAFMENCDFSLARESALDEIQRLVFHKKLTQSQAKCIDVGVLECFFSSELFDRAMKSDNIEREKRFFVAISDLAIENEDIKKYNNTDGMLQGIADCVFEEDDGYVLIDYKTDRVSDSQTLIDRYTMQLKLYAAAFDVLLEKPVKEAYIYSFVLKEVIPIKL